MSSQTLRIMGEILRVQRAFSKAWTEQEIKEGERKLMDKCSEQECLLMYSWLAGTISYLGLKLGRNYQATVRAWISKEADGLRSAREVLGVTDVASDQRY